MKIKTFGYKKTPGGYLEFLEKEWKKLGHSIVKRNYDIIFNIDRSELSLAHEESVSSGKPLYCLILDLSYGVHNGEFRICDEKLLSEEKKIYEHCDSLMTISKETSRVLKEHTGLDSRHVGIPALSCERDYEERERHQYVYYFGRPLDPIKNISTVVQALNGTDFELFVSGEPCPPELFNSIAPDIKIKNFGWLDRANVNTLIKHAHLLIASEIYTGLGMQPIEGALMGTPCLSADIPIKREIWGDILPLYEAQNPDDCREKVLNFNHDEVDMEKAKEVAEWYLPNRVAERILAHEA